MTLHDESLGGDRRSLCAYLEQGNLHLEGQDLGPGTALVSGEGECEWRRTIGAEHMSPLLALLGGAPGNDLRELLEQRWSGPNSYELERLLRECDIPMEFHSYGG